ncbi:hypothetical protein JN531_005755 [Flagellatimonas centrodinii]|uniref:hypothetical protein n=1 Tax=Flagellatimonas centrodinii TaxID=2806210 RepID=UPI001FF0286B|nr:hypothetical protein [Flagellatimonas centrodinii]ULQ47794.1 hypothetical protein JN531_005755 [Flagellatimonas centrodinii]
MSIISRGAGLLLVLGWGLPSWAAADCEAPTIGAAQTPVVSSSATLKVGVLLRDQPRMVAAAADGSVPGAAEVTLQARVLNREGAWWYVRLHERSGWVQAGALLLDPA